jgi:hypothetical protein
LKARDLTLPTVPWAFRFGGQAPRARIVQVMRNGAPPTERTRQFVVTLKTASSLQQVYDTLSQRLSVIGGVRALYYPDGRRLQQVGELFSADFLVACGPEKLDRTALQGRSTSPAGPHQPKAHGPNSPTKRPHLPGFPVLPPVNGDSGVDMDQADAQPSSATSSSGEGGDAVSGHGPSGFALLPPISAAREAPDPFRDLDLNRLDERLPSEPQPAAQPELPSASEFVAAPHDEAPGTSDAVVVEAVARAGAQVDYLVAQVRPIVWRPCVAPAQQRASPPCRAGFCRWMKSHGRRRKNACGRTEQRAPK